MWDNVAVETGIIEETKGQGVIRERSFPGEA